MIAMLFSPVGRWVIACAISLLLAGGAYWKGRMDCTAIEENAILRQRIVSLEEQLSATNRVLQSASDREREADEKLRLTTNLVEDYAAQLANLPPQHVSCSLSPSDIRRMRDITNSGKANATSGSVSVRGGS